MSTLLPLTVWANHCLEWGKRTYVMGIVNVTPDSFSGDGLVIDTSSEENLVRRAIFLAQKFVAEGATLIDVGGESTRPNAVPISAEHEMAATVKVLPSPASLNVHTNGPLL